MNFRNIVLGALTTVALSGCIMADPRPLTFADLGVVEQFQLNDSTFQMSFTSTSGTRNVDPQEVALVHAAKITLDHHFQYFKIKNSQLYPAAQVRSIVVAPPVFQLGFSLGSHYPYRGYGHRHGGYWNAGIPLYGYGGWYGYDNPYGFDGVYNHQYYDVQPNKISYTIECANQTNKTPDGSSDFFDASLIVKTLGAKYGVGVMPISPQAVSPVQK